MKLLLNRPIAIFDLEFTSLNLSESKIIEIAIIKVHPNGLEETFVSKVNPNIPIPQEIQDLTSITNEDVKNAPTFEELAPKVIEFIGDADFVGYNSNKFDIPILVEELLRANIPFDFSDKKSIDVQNIFHKMEQRTLAAAYKFYCESEIENHHTALSDTKATWEVLKAQLEKYPNLKNEVDFLADFSKPTSGNSVDFAGRLARNEKDEVVYNFGKHKGKTVEQVSKEEPGYYGWFISDSTDFPKYTKLKLKEVMDEIKLKAKQQASTHVPKPNKPKDEEIDLKQLDALKAKFGK
jgi:DNA polymerase-3 subunit epsilon